MYVVYTCQYTSSCIPFLQPFSSEKTCTSKGGWWLLREVPLCCRSPWRDPWTVFDGEMGLGRETEKGYSSPIVFRFPVIWQFEECCFVAFCKSCWLVWYQARWDSGRLCCCQCTAFVHHFRIQALKRLWGIWYDFSGEYLRFHVGKLQHDVVATADPIFPRFSILAITANQ